MVDKLSVFWDTHLDTVKTDADGHFELKGDTEEFSKIDPKLNVCKCCFAGSDWVSDHDCNDWLVCRWKIP